jgi:hypothetical protein
MYRYIYSCRRMLEKDDQDDTRLDRFNSRLPPRRNIHIGIRTFMNTTTIMVTSLTNVANITNITNTPINRRI